MTHSEIKGSQPAASGSKPIIFKEDNTSAEAFEKEMSKFVENVRELTPYTVNGLSLVSEFTIAVRIEMEQQGFSLFRRANEAKESEIPIIIRSQKDQDHIVDINALQS